MNWFFGEYREPWRALLRGVFVVAAVAFSASFWSSIQVSTVSGIILFAVLFRIVVGYYAPRNDGTRSHP
jgi:hypothetical protein